MHAFSISFLDGMKLVAEKSKLVPIDACSNRSSIANANSEQNVKTSFLVVCFLNVSCSRALVSIFS